MKRTELLKTKEYWIGQFQTKLFETLEDYLKQNQLTQTQFAEKIGVSKGYVSQILNGDFDHKISKFVELLLACEKVPLVTIADMNDHIVEETHQVKIVSGYSANRVESIVQEEQLLAKKSTKKLPSIQNQQERTTRSAAGAKKGTQSKN